MENIKLDKLTEYKYIYDQINHRREYLSSKFIQMITMYTATATVYFGNLMKFLSKITNYSTIRIIAIGILLFISGIILLKNLFIAIHINMKFSSNNVSAQNVFDTFKKSSTPEIKQSYPKEKIRLNVYKNLCATYIEAAIKNEELLNYIASKQRSLFISIMVNLLLVATNFCIVTIIF